MQADGVPLLKDYDTYQVSLPVRELGIDPPLKLYQLPFYVRECDLDGFATSLTKRMQRPTVAYITAASHSGKSASLVVVLLKQLLRSSEGWWGIWQVPPINSHCQRFVLWSNPSRLHAAWMIFHIHSPVALHQHNHDNFYRCWQMACIDNVWNSTVHHRIIPTWPATLTFHPCPSRSLQKLADDRSHVCFQMWGPSWRSAYPWTTSTWTMRQSCFVWQR